MHISVEDMAILKANNSSTEPYFPLIMYCCSFKTCPHIPRWPPIWYGISNSETVLAGMFLQLLNAASSWVFWNAPPPNPAATLWEFQAMWTRLCVDVLAEWCFQVTSSHQPWEWRRLQVITAPSCCSSHPESLVFPAEAPNVAE